MAGDSPSSWLPPWWWKCSFLVKQFIWAVHFRVILLVQTTGFPKPFEECWWLDPICVLWNYSPSPPLTFESGNWMFRSQELISHVSWKVSHEYMGTTPPSVAMALALVRKHVLRDESSPTAETWDRWGQWDIISKTDRGSLQRSVWTKAKARTEQDRAFQSTDQQTVHASGVLQSLNIRDSQANMVLCWPEPQNRIQDWAQTGLGA